jgi:uncharacterized membrane protein YbhN (UPF0104 family)
MGFLEAIAQSTRFLRSPFRVARALGLTLMIWACYPVSTYFLGFAFGGLRLSFGAAMFVQLCVIVAVVPPQAPGFLGLFQLAALLAVELFGGPEAATGTAGAFAMMLWAVNVVPITLVGVWFLRRERLQLGELARASERAATKEGDEAKRER